MDPTASFLDRLFSNRKSVLLDFIITMFYRISVFNANSADPDQTPQDAESDQGLHRLPLSFYRTQDINWLTVNIDIFIHFSTKTYVTGNQKHMLWILIRSVSAGASDVYRNVRMFL